MSLTNFQVKKLLETTKPLKFKQIALSMFYTRVKNVYKSAPTPANLDTFTKQLNELIAKFGSSIADDYAVMTNV
jgi:hypothetical protein